MDAYLVALARVAEEGEEQPLVRLVAGDVLCTGTARPSTAMLETAERRAETYFDPYRRVWGRKRDQGVVADAKARFLAPLQRAFVAAADEPTALTLAPCTIFALAGGDGLEVPAVVSR
jgi:hypothetical protein